MKVLCGPILRNVSPNSVNIWIALDEDLELLGELNEIASSSSVEKISVADKLFIYMVSLSPEEKNFPQNEIIFYDIKVETKSILLDQKLSYTSEKKLPSFIIAPPAPLLTGSCRKAHSEACDMLVFADSLLEKNWQNLEERPKALFLSGDQLYADNIHDELIDATTILSSYLFGEKHTEYFPDFEGEKTIPLKTSSPGANRSFRHWLDLGEWDRQYFIRKLGMTSDFAKNHLVLFSEYVSAYLLIWSERCWDLIEEKSSFKLTDENLLKFKKELKKVRRLLANTPVYMSLDDHDITDDWNINNYWKDNILPTGNRLISNALSAFWLFQAWGNNPTAPESVNYLNLVKNYINCIRKSDDKIKKAQESLLKSNDHWWQLLKFNDDCEVLILDTRTHRLNGNKKNNPSGLVTPEFLNKMFSEVTENIENLIIVCPSPFFGFSKIENLQALAGQISFVPSLALIERETWQGEINDSTFASSQAVKQALKNKSPKRTMFLSGDVHYGFVKHGKLKESDLNDVWQVTSSALKNEPTFKSAFSLLAKHTDKTWYKGDFHSDRPNLCLSSDGKAIFDGANIAKVDFRNPVNPVCLYFQNESKIEKHSF